MSCGGLASATLGFVSLTLASMNHCAVVAIEYLGYFRVAVAQLITEPPVGFLPRIDEGAITAGGKHGHRRNAMLLGHIEDDSLM
jgi:hypothetical protein